MFREIYPGSISVNSISVSSLSSQSNIHEDSLPRMVLEMKMKIEILLLHFVTLFRSFFHFLMSRAKVCSSVKKRERERIVGEEGQIRGEVEKEARGSESVVTT